MAPVYKIAVIQLHPKIESNYAKAVDFIRQAAAQGATLACLPEYHLTNWVPDDPQFIKLCERSGEYLDRYKALALCLGICIVPGTIVEVVIDGETGEQKLWNVAYFIDNHGRILGRYEKKNLWHPERAHLSTSPHDSHPVFNTPLGVCGILICWDLAFPEAFRELVAQGAKIIVIPTFCTYYPSLWPRIVLHYKVPDRKVGTLADCTPRGLELNPLSEALFLDSTINSRAYENTCAIVFVNAGGPKGATRPGTYAGLSRVSLPFIGALGSETKDSREEAMAVVELDMEILEEAERNYKVREDMARDDWHYTYRHDFPKGRL